MRHSSAVASIVVIMSCAIALGADPTATQPANLLLNGDAEQGKNGQPSVWFAASVPARGLKMALDTTEKHAGKASLLIQNTHKYDQPVANNWAQHLQEVPAGKTLKVRGWIKTADADAANICLQCWDASGEKLLAFESTPVFRGDQEWTKASSSAVIVPSQTQKITLRAALAGVGKVWFDDIEVIETAGDRVEMAPEGAMAANPPASGVQRTSSAGSTTLVDVADVVKERIIRRIPVTQDAMLISYLPDGRYGNLPYVSVADNDGGVRSFIGFPVMDESLAGKKFLLALFSGETRQGQKPMPLEAHDVLADWTQDITWPTMPETAEQPGGRADFDGSAGWKIIDITSIVQKQLKESRTRRGVMLRFAGDNAQTGQTWSQYHFVSREAEGDKAKFKPVLLVVE